MGGVMPNPLNLAEHYRDLANEYRRLSANDSPAETRNYYLYLLESYSTLAEAAMLKKSVNNN
jgi:hypothetical protein